MEYNETSMYQGLPYFNQSIDDNYHNTLEDDFRVGHGFGGYHGGYGHGWHGHHGWDGYGYPGYYPYGYGYATPFLTGLALGALY